MLRVTRGGAEPDWWYSDAEDAFIQEAYQTHGPALVAMVLGRDPASVVAHARWNGFDGGRGATVYDGGLHGKQEQGEGDEVRD